MGAMLATQVDTRVMESFKGYLNKGWSLDYSAVHSGMGITTMRRLRKTDPEFLKLCKELRIPVIRRRGFVGG